MPNLTAINWPFQSYLETLETFKYSPVTNWEDFFDGWFSFSPTVNFGRNRSDLPVERHVLNEVGSYGSQLNKVINALSICVSRLDPDTLTPEESKQIAAFTKLAQDAETAVKSFKNEQSNKGVTRSDVIHLLDQLEGLQTSHPDIFKDLSGLIKTRLEAA